MASIINATSTGVGGVIVSGDASGALQLQTNNGVTAVTISTSQATTFAGDVTLNGQSDLRFADADSSNWVAFQAPTTVASNVTWTLPSADGTSGQALVTDGSGTLSFGSAGISTGKSIAMAMIFGF